MESEKFVLQGIMSHLGDVSSLNCTRLIQRVRNYIYGTKDWGNPRDDYPFPQKNKIAILTAIYRFREGKRAAPVGLFCQSAIIAMSSILSLFGILCKEVAIASTQSDPKGLYINSHALLDVFNTDTARWELHDPSYDCAYGIYENQYPIDSLSFFSLPHEKFCHIPGEKYFPTAGGEPDIQNKLYNYYFPLFNGIVFNQYLGKNPFGMLNLAKVNMTKRFAKQGSKNVVEFFTGVYDKPTIAAYWQGAMLILPPIVGNFNFFRIYPELAHTQKSFAQETL